MESVSQLIFILIAKYSAHSYTERRPQTDSILEMNDKGRFQSVMGVTYRNTG